LLYYRQRPQKKHQQQQQQQQHFHGNVFCTSWKVSGSTGYISKLTAKRMSLEEAIFFFFKSIL
jgi:hypothetical protein